jgi:hypothetical protein
MESTLRNYHANQYQLNNYYREMRPGQLLCKKEPPVFRICLPVVPTHDINFFENPKDWYGIRYW